MLWEFQFTGRILSPNRVNHWRQLHTLKVKHQKLIRLQYMVDKPQLVTPATISLIRIAPRELDYDNLVMAFKNIRDIVASLFFPDKAPGHADASKELTFTYLQEKGLPRQYAIKIKIEAYNDENTV